MYAKDRLQEIKAQKRVLAAAEKEKAALVGPVTIDGKSGEIEPAKAQPIATERKKRGGRPKGAMNRRSQGLLVELRRQFPGYDPIMEMAKIALNEQHTPELRMSANKEIAKYVYPALRAVEHSGGMEDSLEVTVRIVPHGGD